MSIKTKPTTGGLSFATIKQDFPAGLVVFLIALPLCLGIALASGAPLFSGLIAGMVGGIVITVFSGSQLAVSGPAAGLTVIVINAINEIGSYQGFLLAVVLAGVFQLILGFAKAGTIGKYFPSSVIKGMLAAIGFILIMKQIPHALGYDVDYIGDFKFIQSDSENSFTALISAFKRISLGATIISMVSLVILLTWDKLKSYKLFLIPAPLIVVIVGIFLNILFENLHQIFSLHKEHLVTVPITDSIGEFISFFTVPDFSYINQISVYETAFTLAIIASIETLLSIEAVDKIDPFKRVTPLNQELKAQGIGNVVSGLIGGLPLTAVIVRGAVNVNAGAQSKMSALIHGLLLLLSAILIPNLINLIPYASLAAILLVTGYKLTKVSIYKNMLKAGANQFIPFIVTILAIILTDLLIGISIGLAVGVFYVLKNNMQNTYTNNIKTRKNNEPIHIILSEEVSFLNKASILQTLDELPKGSNVIIDGSNSKYIDYDVLEAINDYKDTAKFKNINLELKKIKDIYRFGSD